MQHGRSFRRSVLLALSLLSACAAADPSGASTEAQPHPSTQADSGASTGPFLLGRFAVMEGDVNYAADEFLRALAADPTNPEIRHQAFVACLFAGRPEAARLAREEPNDEAAALLLGDIDARNGNWEAAEQRFALLPRQGVTQVLQPLLLAWAQYGGGHPDTALGTLRPFIEGDRFRAVYAFHAALIADLSNRVPEAGRLYHTAQTDYGAGNLDLARAEASWQWRQGHEAEARQTLAATAEGGSDFAIALPRLQADAANRPIRKATDGIADAYLALAVALRQQDANEFATVLLRLALDLRPDLTAARLLSSDVYDQAKHPDTALAVLAPVSASDPLAPVADLRRAALQDEIGNTDEALRILGHLTVAYPTRSEPWAMEGGILRGKHRYSESVTAYNKAVALVPQPSHVNWPLFYERGIAEERAHQWPLAEADFEYALQLSPDEPFVLNYLGYSWTEMGRNLPRARQMIERAADERPNDGAIVDSLGWITLREGDVHGAVKLLEKAVELEPEDPTVNGHLGDAYWAAGRKIEAQYQWRLALTFNPDPEDVPKLHAKLHDAQQAQGDSAPATAAKAQP
jgi:Flp pilus assembly protein TadD